MSPRSISKLNKITQWCLIIHSEMKENHFCLLINLVHSCSQYVNLLRNQCTTIGCRSCVNNDYTYSCISSCRLLHVCQSVSHLEIKNYT